MNIKDRRLKQAVENIIKEELSRGEFPSSRRVLWRISQYIQEHDLGAPENQIRVARPGYTLDPDIYNQSVNEIYRDLSILYDTIIGSHNTSLASFEEFDTEKSKCEYRLKNLEKQLMEYILCNDLDIMKSTFDIFSDMEKIDFDNTDASIDIVSQEVTLGKTMEAYSIIKPPDDTALSFIVPTDQGISSRTATGKMGNILSNYKNLVWQHEISTTKQMPISGTLLIQFPDPILMNRIQLSLHSIKFTQLNIEVSPDGKNWFRINNKTIEIIQDTVVDFQPRSIKELRITMTKPEADKLLSTKGTPTYLYLYGFKNISFYMTSYKDKAILQSNPFDLAEEDGGVFTIDNVSLDAVEELPNGTSIKYYVALNEDEPNWIPISPMSRRNASSDKVVRFNNIEVAMPEVFNFPSNLSIENVRQLNHLNVNGVKFYKLGAIADRYIIPGSETLFCGKEFFKVDSFIKEQPEDYIPSDSDWTEYQTSYQRITTSSIASGKPVTPHDNIRYSVCIFSRGEQRVSSHKLVANCPTAVYLNGDLLYSGTPDTDTKVDYYFKRGWNELVFMVHCTSENLTLDAGMNILSKGEHIYAIGTPMELTSIFDLQYNIRNNRRDVYSIVNINDEYVLVMNHYIPDLDYEFFYRYTTEESTKTSILFKAELSRDPVVTQLSPKLKEYTLRFS